MAIQYPNFSADQGAVPKIEGAPGVVSAIQKGYAMALLPEKMRQDARLRQAQTQQIEQQNQYYPAQQESMNAYRDAQAQKLQQDAQNPGLKFSGDVKNAYQLQQLKDQAAQDPSKAPYYQAAKQAYDNNEAAKKSLIDYRGVLNSTVDKRYSSPMGKIYSELQDVSEGYRPGTNRTATLTPEEQKKLTGQYNLKLLKDTTDANIRERNLFGHNLDITLGQIDPKSLTQYSGLSGDASLKKEQALSQFGKQSPEYDAYLQNVTRATAASKQLRQYLKDSVQPSAQDKLESLTQPSTWKNNPQQALSQFMAFKDIYTQERQTFAEATQSPDIYTQGAGQGSAAQQPPQGQSPQYAPAPQPQAQPQQPPQQAAPIQIPNDPQAKAALAAQVAAELQKRGGQ